MENPQEFLDINLEELKALQIGEVKVIDGVELKGVIYKRDACHNCIFFICNCRNIRLDCFYKDWEFGFKEVK